MKTLVNYVNEELKNHKNLLQYLISNDILTDDDIVAIAKRHNIDPDNDDNFKNWKIDIEKLNKILAYKGLDSDSFANNTSITKQLIKMFDDNKDVNFLQQIINTDDLKHAGICTLSEFTGGAENGDSYEPTIKNIYDDFCSKWEKTAKQIAFINNIKSKNSSASIGNFELLMRLIIKDVDKHNAGDVHCIGDIAIEVKASPLNGFGGARVSGQINDMQKPDVIYKTLFNNIQGGSVGFIGQSETKKVYAEPYFQKYDNIPELEKILNMYDSAGTMLDITYSDSNFYYYLVKSVFAQYSFKDEKIIEKFASLLNKINIGDTKFISYTKESGYKIKQKEIIDIVGALQLYMYKEFAKFQYLVIFNKNNGDYICFNNDNIDKIENVLKYCKFQPIGSGGARESACRIGIRKT